MALVIIRLMENPKLKYFKGVKDITFIGKKSATQRCKYRPILISEFKERDGKDAQNSINCEFDKS